MGHKELMNPSLRYWGRCVAFFEDETGAGFFLITTHPLADGKGEGYAAFSERSGEIVSASLVENVDKLETPYGREYVFSFEDAEGRTIYLENIN